MSGIFPIDRIREDFPLIGQKQKGKGLVYLDSAATTLKPNQVIDRLNIFYREQAANVHRGAYVLSDQATEIYEGAREKVRTFLNAANSSEIVFTRGTTESLNLVASSYVRKFLEPGDEIILTEMEHHSNIVPWQMIAEEKGLEIKVVPIDDKGELIFSEFEKLLSRRTKLLSMVVCSNSLGTVNPVKKYIFAAHAVGAVVVLDAAQSISVMSTDVQELDCDFLAFSGHKLFGPFGIGVLYGKEHLLNSMPPYQGGGSMINRVQFSGTTFLDAPNRFEAGTPNISGAIGLGEAIKYTNSIGLAAIGEYEKGLLAYATESLEQIEGLKIIGQSSSKTNILSFTVDGIHHADMASVLDQQGLAIRAGHHCCQPVMDHFGLGGTMRASFSIYNNRDDVNALRAGIEKAREFF